MLLGDELLIIISSLVVITYIQLKVQYIQSTWWLNIIHIKTVGLCVVYNYVALANEVIESLNLKLYFTAQKEIYRCYIRMYILCSRYSVCIIHLSIWYLYFQCLHMYVQDIYTHNPYIYILTLNLGVSASAGTGMMISTLLAVERLLNCPLACKGILISLYN